MWNLLSRHKHEWMALGTVFHLGVRKHLYRCLNCHVAELSIRPRKAPNVVAEETMALSTPLPEAMMK